MSNTPQKPQCRTVCIQGPSPHAGPNTCEMPHASTALWRPQAKPWRCSRLFERTQLLKAPIGLLPTHRWFMPHDLPTVICSLLQSSAEVPLANLMEAAEEQVMAGLDAWNTEEHCPQHLAAALQAAHKALGTVDFSTPEGLSLALDVLLRSWDIATNSNRPTQPRTEQVCRTFTSGVWCCRRVHGSHRKFMSPSLVSNTPCSVAVKMDKKKQTTFQS